MKTSDAFANMAWCNPTQEIIITFNSGAVWAYPAKVQEYAVMHRSNVSAGKYLNRVLKKRGGRIIKARPLAPRQLSLVDAKVAELSLQFSLVTGLI